jgi:hypothetical protein
MAEIDEIREMTPEQMQALEDKMVADEAVAATEGSAPKEVETPKEPPAETPPEEDLTKHIAPPSKWAAERHAKRELQRQLEETKAKAEKAEVLENEVGQLKTELEQIKAAIQDKGIISKSFDPAAVFTDEKIEEIRNEFGDELADMLKATSEILKASTKPEVVTVTQPEANPTVDPDLLKAIDNNDELSYWRENSPALWARAVAKDDELLAVPEYAQLSYPERFAKVVELVKNEVMEGAKRPDETTAEMPPSLSGAPGVPSQSTGTNALDRMLAIDDSKAQMKFYNSLPEKQRDEIDRALNI